MQSHYTFLNFCLKKACTNSITPKVMHIWLNLAVVDSLRNTAASHKYMYARLLKYRKYLYICEN
jgi:hypothetical protein